MEKILNQNNMISITIDVEGDKLHSDFEPQPIIDSLNYCEDIIKKISEVFSLDVPVTWFIRCDDTVSKKLGKPESFLEKINKFISRRINKGDVLGLHLHFEVYENNNWIKESRENYQLDILNRAANGWKRFFGILPSYTRMGEAFMNNSIAKALDELGVYLDSSSLPGRKRVDTDFNFDWKITPRYPYKPSKNDYRIPNKKNSRNFIELPYTMIGVRTPYDEKKIERYFNLAYKKEYLFESINKLPKKDLKIVSNIHTHEIVVGSKKHILFPENHIDVIENLINLKKRISKFNFVSLKDLL